MHKSQHRNIKNIYKQISVTHPKVNKSTVSDSNDNKVDDILSKEFKRMITGIQHNSKKTQINT
jgi:hypothetical protein